MASGSGEPAQRVRLDRGGSRPRLRPAGHEQAKELHERIDKPNLLVKIPGTEPGLGAIEDSIAAGRSINITLLLLSPAAKSSRRTSAGSSGSSRAAATPAESPRSRATSCPADTEADKRLEAIGSEEALALRGKLAIANAKLAYQNYLEAFRERWKALEEKGATRQRCLWASTSTKNPEYRDVLYVEELIGPDTVDTMPEETIQAFRITAKWPRR